MNTTTTSPTTTHTERCECGTIMVLEFCTESCGRVQWECMNGHRYACPCRHYGPLGR